MWKWKIQKMLFRNIKIYQKIKKMRARAQSKYLFPNWFSIKMKETMVNSSVRKELIKYLLNIFPDWHFHLNNNKCV